MDKNTSVAGATAPITKTPHETVLEKINTFSLHALAEKAKKESQKKLKQLEEERLCVESRWDSLYERFVGMILCILNANLLSTDLPVEDRLADGEEIAAEFCANLSVEEFVALEKDFPQYPVIKSNIGFFALCWYLWHNNGRNPAVGMYDYGNKFTIFETVDGYFSLRKKIVYDYGEKAVDEKLREWHEDMCRYTSRCRQDYFP